MRQTRLANPSAVPTRVERVSEGMRDRVFNSAWPVVDTTASVMVSGSPSLPSPDTAAPDIQNSSESDKNIDRNQRPEILDAETLEGNEGIDIEIGPEPFQTAQEFAEESVAGDGTDEFQIVGAVGVSQQGMVKLYVLEHLPEEALEQVQI